MPKLFAIFNNYGVVVSPYPIAISAITTSYRDIGGKTTIFANNSYQYFKKSSDGKTLYWYGAAYDGEGYPSGASHLQANNSGQVYHWIAIG